MWQEQSAWMELAFILILLFRCISEVGNKEFVLQVSSDESNIDVNKVVSFADRIYKIVRLMRLDPKFVMMDKRM